MQLFILRHGQAEMQRTTDEARQLTAKGRNDVALSIAHSLKDLMGVNQLWASPLVRAQQTATIARDLLADAGVQLSIHTTDLLTPEANCSALFEALQNSRANSILLASHMPLVGNLLDVLCGTKSGFHSMNTSSLACVDCEIAAPGLGTLRWLRHVNE